VINKIIAATKIRVTSQMVIIFLPLPVVNKITLTINIFKGNKTPVGRKMCGNKMRRIWGIFCLC